MGCTGRRGPGDGCLPFAQVWLATLATPISLLAGPAAALLVRRPHRRRHQQCIPRPPRHGPQRRPRRGRHPPSSARRRHNRHERGHGSPCWPCANVSYGPGIHSQSESPQSESLAVRVIHHSVRRAGRGPRRRARLPRASRPRRGEPCPSRPGGGGGGAAGAGGGETGGSSLRTCSGSTRRARTGGGGGSGGAGCGASPPALYIIYNI